MTCVPQLCGQTVLVLGGTAGIGLATARRARAEGADVIITARGEDRLQRVGLELGASIAAFDVLDFDRLERFFAGLSGQVDHVLVTGPRPYRASLADFDFERARRDAEAHLWLPCELARAARAKVRAGGTLLFLGATSGRRQPGGFAPASALAAAQTALTRGLALELAPVRVNLIAVGFVGIEPAEVAALALELMTNAAVTGATFDIDGGQGLIA